MKDKHPLSGKSFDDTYMEQEDMFGHPYKELQEYFRKYPLKGTVLDLGCGQGRDALFLASIGYRVTAVDNSKVGVKQMISKSKKQEIPINAIIADIQRLKLDKKFDVILFDMVLHSFDQSQQVELLKRYSAYLNNNGIVCIVYPDDMNSAHFMAILKSLPHKWKLKDEIEVKDTPKIPGEKNDHIFRMIIVEIE